MQQPQSRQPVEAAKNTIDADKRKEEVSYLPKGFIDAPGMCLLPTFYQPETEELRWSTHLNVRKTLFFGVFRNIKFCEFKRLKNEDDDFFELEKVDPNEPEGTFDKWIETKWSKEKERGRLIQCQRWTLKRTISKQESLGFYKVKVYHMDDDEFKCKLYPVSWLDTVRYLWFDRDFWRIM